jgi:N-acetylmuramoyl-L-alanine amidase
MLDPAGDANDTGRLIDDVFERSLTLATAQLLKQELENSISGLQVILTRSAGETIEPFQNAQFANRCNVDFFIRLHYVQQNTLPDVITLYHVGWGDECMVHNNNDMAFVCYDKAYVASMKRTTSWAHFLQQSLNRLATGSCTGVFAIPCKPLMGITAPALCIEISLSTTSHGHTLVKNMCAALTELIRNHV